MSRVTWVRKLGSRLLLSAALGTMSVGCGQSSTTLPAETADSSAVGLGGFTSPASNDASSSGGSGNGAAGSAGLGGAGGGAGASTSDGASDASGPGGSAGTAGFGGSGGTAGAAATGGQSGTSGGAGSDGGATTGPCDIYASGNAPCVAAHSTVRALFGSYSGNLYQVRRASDKTTKDIGVLTVGGVADAAVQDTFCANTSCTIAIIYDQSGKGNHLTVGAAGGNGKADVESNATALKVTVSGHTVYAVYIAAGNGYRNDHTSGIAMGNGAQGAYMVASGTHVNSGCCFDYGNAETNNKDTGNGHMEAVYLGRLCWFTPCDGSGPWAMADLENGLFSGGNGPSRGNTSVPYDYVTAMVKGHSTGYAIKAGNSQSGDLKTMYSGALPSTAGYSPMHLEGAIILGVGGDNSNVSVGTFFEGAMTAAFPSDATDDAVQANIVAAGYAR